MYTILQNTSKAELPIEPPIKKDGSYYPLEMLFNGLWECVYSDTYDELLEILIPGYIAGNEEERAYLITSYFQQAAAIAQALFLNNFDPSEYNDEEKAILLAHKYNPVEIDTWASEIPLILLDVCYEPYTNVAKPQAVGDGVILWLKIGNAETVLRSLSSIGNINLFVYNGNR